MNLKELNEKLLKDLKDWQKIEDASIVSTGQIMQSTDNSIIRLVMEIIQRDSMLHAMVQGWIADTLEFKTISLSTDELLKVSKQIQQHITIEKKMIENTKQALDSVKGKRNLLIQQYFLNYLQQDETKHDNLLESLGLLAKGMRDGG
ncbi:hypothetical protein ACFLXC_02640 [Chloroflexota bacterium]